MSPHILSVLTSITQPPRSALLTPVLIPCVCQIKRPRPEWFSHVSSSVFTFPTHTSRNVIWQQKFCFFIYSHTLHPSSLHLILLFTCKPPSPFDVAVTSHECFWNLREANSHFHWFSRLLQWSSQNWPYCLFIHLNGSFGLQSAHIVNLPPGLNWIQPWFENIRKVQQRRPQKSKSRGS